MNSVFRYHVGNNGHTAIWLEVDGENCGLSCKDEGWCTDLMYRFGDPFTMYRAARMLLHFPGTGLIPNSLEIAYNAAGRDAGHDKTHLMWVERAIARIGLEKFRTIMSPEAKVPSAVIKAALRMCTSSGSPIGWMTNEIRLGTIAWEDRFAEYGVSTPAETDRRLALMEPYQHVVKVAIISCQCRGLRMPGSMAVEYAITQLVDSGATTIFKDKKEVVALAILILRLYGRLQSITRVLPIDPVVQNVSESGEIPCFDDLNYVTECVYELYSHNSSRRQRKQKCDELLALYRRFVNSTQIYSK